MTDPRFRINAKETAKGAWQLDVTVEMGTDFISITESSDLASKKEIALGQKLLDLVNETQKLFKKDGKRLVSDLSD